MEPPSIVPAVVCTVGPSSSNDRTRRVDGPDAPLFSATEMLQKKTRCV